FQRVGLEQRSSGSLRYLLACGHAVEIAEVVEPVAIERKAVELAKAQHRLVHVEAGKKVIVEWPLIAATHPDNDSQVGIERGVEPDLPTQCASAGLDAANDDDRGHELLVHMQEVSARI